MDLSQITDVDTLKAMLLGQQAQLDRLQGAANAGQKQSARKRRSTAHNNQMYDLGDADDSEEADQENRDPAAAQNGKAKAGRTAAAAGDDDEEYDPAADSAGDAPKKKRGRDTTNHGKKQKKKRGRQAEYASEDSDECSDDDDGSARRGAAKKRGKGSGGSSGAGGSQQQVAKAAASAVRSISRAISAQMIYKQSLKYSSSRVSLELPCLSLPIVSAVLGEELLTKASNGPKQLQVKADQGQLDAVFRSGRGSAFTKVLRYGALLTLVDGLTLTFNKSTGMLKVHGSYSMTR